MPLRLLVADDHAIVRAGLRAMFADQPQFQVVGEAASGLEAISLVDELLPDLLLLDVRMPHMDGITALGEIKKVYPTLPVLMLTTYEQDSEILKALKAGANGYLLKDISREKLFAAILDCVAGRSVLAPEVTARVVQHLKGPVVEPLSGREIEVLELVAQGASNKEIARALYISEATVKSHLIRIFRRLGVADRTAATTLALESGLLKRGKGFSKSREGRWEEA